MKKLLTILIFISSTISFSQDVSFGLEVSPSFQLQSIRNKSTGLFSSISGYGFNLGVPIKFMLSDNKSFSTGLSYEFSAFDNKVNNFLISSLRLNSLHIPIMYNYPIIDGLYINAGGGINYIFKSKEYGGGIWLNTNSLTNNFQPYIATGLSTIAERSTNTYELGVNARYHIIDIWKYATTTSTKIIAIDLNLKYYF